MLQTRIKIYDCTNQSTTFSMLIPNYFHLDKKKKKVFPILNNKQLIHTKTDPIKSKSVMH